MMSEGTEAYAFADGRWNKTKARVGAALTSPVRGRMFRRDTTTAVPPADVRAQPRMFRSTYRRYPDGTFVGIGRELASGTPSWSLPASTPLGLVIRPRSHEETVVPFPDADHHWRCEQAPSADGKAYADCHVHDALIDERRLYVLDERTWARVLLPSRDLDAPIAVAKDGSIWMGLAEPARLVVRSPTGHVTSTALPAKAPDALSHASYRGKFMGLNLPRAQMQNVQDLERIVDLAPTPGGSMIVMAREEGLDGALVVMRAGWTAAGVERPDVLGSEIDQLVDIRNAEEPKRWIGHCRAVFVRLSASPAQRDVGEGVFVRGWLHGEKVNGVIFTDESHEEASFERGVTYFVDTHTTNPASPPDVTCTLPMLDFVR